MTAHFIFELSTACSAAEVERTVAKLWQGDRARVRLGSHGKRYFCELFYRFGEADEKARVTGVVDYLFSISADGRVYYYPFHDFLEPAPEHENPLSVEDIFSPQFEPRLDTGGPLKIRLRRPQ